LIGMILAVDLPLVLFGRAGVLLEFDVETD